MTTIKHFDISQLPSLKDGMTVQEEAIKRRKTCRFIEEAGRILKLPRVAVATAMVFFHRFYAKHSFREHERFEVAVACLLLAAKTEESPKKLATVITECHKLKVRGMQGGRISVEAGGSASVPDATLDPKEEEYKELKERILLLERVILHTIGFELSIDHPYKFLVGQIKRLVHKKEVEYIDAADAVAGSTTRTMAKMQNEMVQYAMNFANDSMQTTLCLQFPPQQIATACVYLAGNFVKVKPAGKKDWIEVLGQPDVEGLASICLQIIELIVERRGGEENVFRKIRSDLDKLKGTSHRSDNRPKPPPPPPGPPDAKRPRVS